jgi:ribonucleotide monophosphatase NagD (HAD superfamily)
VPGRVEWIEVHFHSGKRGYRAKESPSIPFVSGRRCPKCVVVEDSVFGVKAAKRAGMGCIAIASGAYSMEELKEQNPDLTLPSIKEKDVILNFILNNA